MFKKGQMVRVKPLEELRAIMNGNYLNGIFINESMLTRAGQIARVSKVDSVAHVPVVCLGDRYVYPLSMLEPFLDFRVGDWAKIKSWNQLLRKGREIEDIRHGTCITFPNSFWLFTSGMRDLCGLIGRITGIYGESIRLGCNPVLERRVSENDRVFSWTITKNMITPIIYDGA